MRINHNIASLNTYRQLTANNANSSKSLEKLSSGYRINRAGDDAAGLAISEKMRAQIRGLDMASKNAQDSISLIQTAEGALNETQSILQRMRELAVQASSDTNVSIDRSQIQKEINQLTSEVNRIGNTTEFNTLKLLKGDLSSEKVTGTSSTTTIKQLTKAYTVNYSQNVTGSTGKENIANAIEGGAIKFVASDFMDSVEAGTTATGVNTYVEIKRTSTGFTVTLDSGTGAASFSAVDTVVANSEGNFVYNEHGVSFTIKATAAATISAGTTLKAAGISAGATSKAVKDDWSSNTASAAATITGGISIDGSAADSIKNATQLQIELKASAALTVKFLNSAGQTLHTDDLDDSAVADGDITYSAHGVTFTIKVADELTTASLTLKLDRSSSTTVKNLTVDQSLKFQVGANANQTIALGIEDMRAIKLGITTTAAGTNFTATKGVTDGTNSTAVEYALSVSSSSTAANAITILNDAINTVSEERSKLGSVQNRLEHTINNLGTTSENLTASESRIRDVDMAKEMMEFTKNNILTQAAQAMLAQANQQPQGVLQLLR